MSMISEMYERELDPIKKTLRKGWPELRRMIEKTYSDDFGELAEQLDEFENALKALYKV